jgi:hypothetical protein
MGYLICHSTCLHHWRVVIEYELEERDGEYIQQVECLAELQRDELRVVKKGVCISRADRESEVQATRREKEKWIKVVTHGLLRLAAWIFIFKIIWTQLFHCK